MANNEDICCSCGNITSFPEAFFHNFHVADVGIIVCASGKFSFCCEDVDYVVNKGETAFLSHGVCASQSPATAQTAPLSSSSIGWTPSAISSAAPW